MIKTVPVFVIVILLAVFASGVLHARETDRESAVSLRWSWRNRP